MSTDRGRRVVRHRLFAVLGTLVSPLVLVACGPPAGPSDPSTAAAPGGALQELAASAREAGADDAQVAALESGTVDYAAYEAAMARSFACARESGATVEVNGTHVRHGVTQIDATTIVGAASTDALDECYVRHAKFVDMYWQVSSPDAVAYDERRAAALLDPLRRCLAERGVDHAADASFRELADLAFGSDATAADGTSCLDAIGYTTWEG